MQDPESKRQGAEESDMFFFPLIPTVLLADKSVAVYKTVLTTLRQEPLVPPIATSVRLVSQFHLKQHRKH